MKKQKPIPDWAIRAAEELNEDGWFWTRDVDEDIVYEISFKNIKKVARIIADAYNAPLEAAIRKHVKMFDKIMRGPVSRERGQDLAEAIRILESNIK